MSLLLLIGKQKQYKEFLFAEDKFTFDFFLSNAATSSDSWPGKKIWPLVMSLIYSINS